MSASATTTITTQNRANGNANPKPDTGSASAKTNSNANNGNNQIPPTFAVKYSKVCNRDFILFHFLYFNSFFSVGFDFCFRIAIYL